MGPTAGLRCAGPAGTVQSGRALLCDTEPRLPCTAVYGRVRRTSALPAMERGLDRRVVAAEEAPESFHLMPYGVFNKISLKMQHPPPGFLFIRLLSLGVRH